MLTLRIVAYTLAAWLLAAHFLRADALLLMALCLATPVLFWVRERWSLWLLQALAFVAGGIWLLTAWQVIGERRFFGQSWTLSAVILLSVAAFSVMAGLLLRGSAMQARYRLR